MGLTVLHGERLTNAKIASMPVVYEEEPWRTAMRKTFQRIIACHDRFGRDHQKGHSSADSHVWSALMRIAAIASIRAKKPGWRSEEEWRVLALRSDNLGMPARFKPDGAEYIEMPLRDPPKRFAFDEILLGPHQTIPSAQAIVEARQVLIDAGYPPAELPPINLSTVAFSADI